VACCAITPASRALLPPPPPDGGYPGFNTAEGTSALFSLTSGVNNTALGFQALFHDTTGSNNTATGLRALFSNTGGVFNTANGRGALLSNTTGSRNTASGVDALRSNTMGTSNTAIGVNALYFNSDSFNTAIGDGALGNNTTGRNNTANGYRAQNLNTTGSDNTAVGWQALVTNTAGSSNIALGWAAGLNLSTGYNNIYIGNLGGASESSTIRIGRSAPSFGTNGTHTATYIAGIFGSTVPNGAQVVAGREGRLGTVASSQRFKDDIKPMGKASEAILALKPVAFHYKKEVDPDGVPQFGLVAEQVEKVNPDLVARDGEGKVYSVRYEAVNAMLLNEFLKEHRTVQELKSAAAKHEAIIAHQQKQIEVLTEGLQKVSAQLEVNKTAPQVVNNN
jgi:hypothetical protein